MIRMSYFIILVLLLVYISIVDSYLRIASSFLLSSSSSSLSSLSLSSSSSSSSSINKTYPKHIHSNEYPNDNWEHILGTIANIVIITLIIIIIVINRNK